jgi:putative sterol carrier protein
MPAIESAPSVSGLFGRDWAERLERELQTSESFRAAAAAWKGSLAFVLEPDGTPGYPERRALFVDLTHGSRRAVRAALPGDLEAATFRLNGTASAWRRLLAGDLDPVTALRTGALKLTKGFVFSLLPHLQAARILFDCARRVPVEEAR